MRKFLFFLLFPAALTSRAQGTAQDSAWIRENYYKIERSVPMRDGIKLFTSMDGWDFYSSFGKPRPQPTTVGPTGFEFHSKDNYEWFLRTGALKNIMKLRSSAVASTKASRNLSHSPPIKWKP